MWEVSVQPAPSRNAADSWTRFPSSRITDLRSASTHTLASCGRKSRMASPMASCRDPRSIRPSACAFSSDAELTQREVMQLRGRPEPAPLARSQAVLFILEVSDRDLRRTTEIECDGRNWLRWLRGLHLRP